MGGNVENDARKVGVFDLVAIGIVWVAHDPRGASVAHDLALFDNVVDPEANVVDTNEIFARTLRRRVRLELQEGKIHDAICQEHAFGERAVELRYLLEPERLLIELCGLPRVLNAQCDMADTAFRLLCHGKPPFGCSRASAGLVSVFGNGSGTGLHRYPRRITEPASVSSLPPEGRVKISRGRRVGSKAVAGTCPHD